MPTRSTLSLPDSKVVFSLLTNASRLDDSPFSSYRVSSVSPTVVSSESADVVAGAVESSVFSTLAHDTKLIVRVTIASIKAIHLIFFHFYVLLYFCAGCFDTSNIILLYFRIINTIFEFDLKLSKI